MTTVFSYIHTYHFFILVDGETDDLYLKIVEADNMWLIGLFCVQKN